MKENKYKTAKKSLPVNQYLPSSRWSSGIVAKMNGVKTRALIDTGAAISCISLCFATKCGLKQLIDPRLKIFLKGFHSEVETAGELQIEGVTFLWSFYVVGYLDIIIGADILESMKAKINYGKKTLNLHLWRSGFGVGLIDYNQMEEACKCEQCYSLFVNEEKLTEECKDVSKEQLNLLDRKWYETQCYTPKSFESGKLKFINVNIGGIVIHAFLESGADQNIISEKTINKCGIGHLNDCEQTCYTIGIDGKPRETAGFIKKCDILLGSVPLTVSFDVSSNLDYDAVLGVSVFKKLNANINYEERVVEFLKNNTLVRMSLIEKDNKLKK